jgi:hypothetical protein
VSKIAKTPKSSKLDQSHMTAHMTVHMTVVMAVVMAAIMNPQGR